MFHRKSPRAQWYDYSSPGMYFITICTQDREHYFGDIVKGEMQLSDIGKICDTHIQHVPNHRKNIDIHEYIVMPNHIHILLYTNGNDNRTAIHYHNRTQDAIPTKMVKGPSYGSLGYIVNLLKGGITRECKKQGLAFARQSRYHDHIVHNQHEYDNIRRYIQMNVEK